MNVSYLMISYNRRDGLLANIAAVYKTRPHADIWVVDNASTDGTVDAVRATYPRVRLITSDRNLGMPARNLALRQMHNAFAVLLDDDSHPLDDAVEQSIEHMKQHRNVAAVVGRVVLPNGNVEAPAMPGVMLGGASCVRIAALRDVGFFPHDFFRQAEEYDLSCRLWNAGWQIERFENIRYLHNKVAAAGRVSSVVASLDLKHNLIVAARYLPEPIAQRYREDFIQRYGAILKQGGFESEMETTLAEVEEYIADESTLRRQPIDDDAFESLFEHRRQRGLISSWVARHGIRRVAIADFSKNLFATHHACQCLGLHIAAIVDDRPAFANEIYRRVPVKSLESLSPDAVDGIVVSNTNPAQMDGIVARMKNYFGKPTLSLWHPHVLAADAVAVAA